MPKPRARARLTPTQAKQEFLERSEELWEEFTTRFTSDREMTFDDIEVAIGERRREIVGEFVQLVLRQGDLGAEPEPPACGKCGKPMDFQGYLERTIHGLEMDIEIPRAYYYCSTCKVGFFPPGSTPTTANG